MGIYEEIVEDLESWDINPTPGAVASRCNDYIENLKSYIGKPTPNYIDDLTGQTQEEKDQEMLKQITEYENFLKDYNIVENVDTTNGICFVYRFSGEYFWWQIERETWNNYWFPKLGPIVYLRTGIDKRDAIVFVNDPVNETIGCSCGSFASAMEALKNYWND